jgi:hypothetical protein
MAMGPLAALADKHRDDGVDGPLPASLCQAGR